MIWQDKSYFFTFHYIVQAIRVLQCYHSFVAALSGSVTRIGIVCKSNGETTIEFPVRPGSLCCFLCAAAFLMYFPMARSSGVEHGFGFESCGFSAL